MHARAMEYVKRYATAARLTVCEIGSRNINGTVRGLFPNALWTGIDLYAGRAVDVVGDAANWSPPSQCDLVVCCEVLEHAERWDAVVKSGCGWLKPGGRVIVTCAGPGRRDHSGIDGKLLRDVEHYCNVHPVPLCELLEECGVVVDSLELFHTDTRASGVKQ